LGGLVAEVLAAEHHDLDDKVRSQPALSIHPPHLDLSPLEPLDPLANSAQIADDCDSSFVFWRCPSRSGTSTRDAQTWSAAGGSAPAAPFIRVFAPLDRPWPPFVDSRLRLTSLWV